MSMILFSLFLLPISLVIFYFQKQKNTREHLILVIFLGILIGSFFLTYKILFPSVAFTFSNNFFFNFLYILVMQTILPIFIPYLILYILSKDIIKDKISYFFPFTAAFNSIYIIYLIFEAEKPYSGFLLFVKPLLILSLLIFMHIWIYKAYTINNKNPKIVITNIVFLVIAICLPALVESIWIFNFPIVTWLIPSLIFFFLIALLLFPKSTIKD